MLLSNYLIQALTLATIEMYQKLINQQRPGGLSNNVPEAYYAELYREILK